MKPDDLKELSSQELEQRVKNLKEELFNLRFQMATGQLENNMRIRQVKRDIARVKTILRERELRVKEA